MLRELTLRFASPADALRLGKFFKGLSEETVRLYEPHPFNLETAKARCSSFPEGYDLSIIAVDAMGDVVGYCVYLRGFCEADLMRRGHHVHIYNAGSVVTVAPCVAEGKRGVGIGSMMLRFAAYQARSEGNEALVLYGGVRTDNVRAFRTYQSLGFRILGWWEHPDCPVNYDMAWDLTSFGTGSATGTRDGRCDRSSCRIRRCGG